ncbi:unnamed protein product [Blepharisma stoltei]|uniref:TLC domain-containing protein n=1 Tax=Blepharisma stoltei TaxID=1481888 RepID=A0AAU9JM45_9CILI|nr:unnamed protein product [Blepharisma stoltei]
MVNPLLVALLSAPVWTIVFILVSLVVNINLPTKELWDFRNRIVSFIHGLFLLVSTTMAISSGRQMGDLNDDFEITVIAISLGYFIYDTLCMWKFGIYDNFIMLHHGLTIIGELTGVSGTYGTIEIMYGTFFAEVSNPFLHIKEILKCAGQKETKSHLLAELVFIVAFFIGRFILGPPITYGVVTSWNVFWLVRLMGFLLEMQSFKWAYTMYFIVKKRYREYKIRCKTGQSLPWFVEIKKDK